MHCPELLTARLALRELDPDALSADYVGWLNDPAINQYLEVRHAPQDAAGVAAFVRDINASDHSYLFGIHLREAGDHIGNIKLGPVDRRNLRGDIGYLIGDRSQWSKGYAGEAIAAVTRFAFDTLGLQKVCAGVYAPNTASIGTLRKQGFREAGRRLRHWRTDDGWADDVLMEKLSGDA